MSENCSDMTGRWDGTFSYPDVPEAGPITPFVVTLRDCNGVLKGDVLEPHEFQSGTAHSTLIGQRVGRSAHFAKTYHGAGEEYRETVLYCGMLSADGETVSGEWRIDHWRGPFEMTRELSAEPCAEVEVAVEVAIPAKTDVLV